MPDQSDARPPFEPPPAPGVRDVVEQRTAAVNQPDVNQADAVQPDADDTTPLPAGEVLAAGTPAMAEAAEGTPDAATPEARRRTPWLVGAFALAIAGIVSAFFVVQRDPEPGPKPLIAVDVWVPYWTMDDAAEGLADREGQLRTVSPFWLAAVSADGIEPDPNAASVDVDRFISETRRRSMPVVPTISDGSGLGEMAEIVTDPAQRARHVSTIVDLVAEEDFDGVDINYENFAFVDDRSSWASTRPGWVAFIAELGEQLGSEDKLLTVSIPFVLDDEQTPDSGYWVYDPAAIAPHVDAVRVMAYDFSVAEPGPIAPLPWVSNVVDGMVDLVGDPDKVVLGIPLYGRNWPVFTRGTCPDDAPGLAALSTRNADELIARRNATPIYDDVTAETFLEYDLVVDGTANGEPVSCVQTRQVFYVDATGVRARLDLARDRRLGGVSLWALGFDDAAVWNAIAPSVEPVETSTTSSASEE